MRWANILIKEALDKHQKWLKGETGGKRFECHDGGLHAAHLMGVNLMEADLTGADLVAAILDGANLSAAILDGANLTAASLYRASLIQAKLDGARLDKAMLIGANLTKASFNGATFYQADLSNTTIDEKIKIKRYPLVCPESGDFIGWKKAGGLIVKLKVTGKRSSAYMRKCRCSEAEVLAIENIDGTKAEKQIVNSDYEPNFVYEVGKTVSVENFDEDRWNECSSGIHFFITRQEAVEYK